MTKKRQLLVWAVQPQQQITNHFGNIFEKQPQVYAWPLDFNKYCSKSYKCKYYNKLYANC